jgi:hypothetical protein
MCHHILLMQSIEMSDHKTVTSAKNFGHDCPLLLMTIVAPQPYKTNTDGAESRRGLVTGVRV